MCIYNIVNCFCRLNVYLGMNGLNSSILVVISVDHGEMSKSSEYHNNKLSLEQSIVCDIDKRFVKYFCTVIT